jgi:ankyrin repeat protein
MFLKKKNKLFVFALSGPEGQTPLHLLCGAEDCSSSESECVELAHLLLAQGASVDALDNMGKTPVLRACESESHKLVHVLCDAGCNVNIHDYNGDSPIKVDILFIHFGIKWFFVCLFFSQYSKVDKGVHIT